MRRKASKGNFVSLNNSISIQKRHNLEIHKSSKMKTIEVTVGMALREKKIGCDFGTRNKA